MKRTIAVICALAMLASGAVFAQASGAKGASGSIGMKDSSMSSDLMASGAMGVKQHPRKHATKHEMNAEQPASGEKGR